MTNLYKYVYTFALALSFAFIILASTPNVAYPATITLLDDDMIVIDGEILLGDGAAFVDLLNENPKVLYVGVNSNGGTVPDGMEISNAIHERKLTTMIAEGSGCYSMCGIIFLSGDKRVSHVRSGIKLHAPYLEWEDGHVEISFDASAELSWWLGKIGIPLNIVTDMLSRGPDEYIYYSAHDLVAFGVHVTILE
jgi:hypothetical protein